MADSNQHSSDLFNVRRDHMHEVHGGVVNFIQDCDTCNAIQRLEEQLETQRKALADAIDVAIWLSGLPCLRESDAWSYWESDARPRLYKAMALLDSNPAMRPDA